MRDHAEPGVESVCVNGCSILAPSLTMMARSAILGTSAAVTRSCVDDATLIDQFLRTGDEISELLGLRPGTVKSHLHRARQRLALFLREDGSDE